MTRLQGGAAADVREMQGIESRLAVALDRTADQIAHSECLDVEQRAEVYTIIDAIQADTRGHRKTIKLLTRRLTEGAADA
jgi:hypothetical protein